MKPSGAPICSICRAEARAALLEVIAIAGQRPHQAGGRCQDLPTEDCAIERLGAVEITGGETVEVQCAVLVDDLRTLVVHRLPDVEHRSLGIGEDGHPPLVHHVEGIRHHPAARIADR